MDQRRSDIPKYRLHRPSGRAVVTIASRDIYLGTYRSAASRREYDRVIAEWISAGRPQRVDVQRGLTVVELCRDHLRWAKTYYRIDGKPTGEMHPLKAVIRVLRTLYGAMQANEFGPLALKAVRQKMIELDWSRRTINQQVHRIRRIFRWAVSEELLPPSVTQALDSVSGLRAGKSAARETSPVRPVDDAIFEATLPHLSETVRAMAQLQRLTGARPSEICIIRPVDVDPSGDVWCYRPSRHKTQLQGKQRVIYFGPRAQEILRPYLANASESYCFSAAVSESSRRDKRHEARRTPLQYGNRPGTNRSTNPKRPSGVCYTVASYRRAITRACEIAFQMPRGLRRISKALAENERLRLQAEAARWRRIHCWAPNRLRHSAATTIRRQFGLEAAQVTLGHSAADVTQIYAERDLQKAAKVMQLIG